MIKLFAFEDHQNKGAAYADALADHGYFQARHVNVQGLRFLLTDADWSSRAFAAAARSREIPIFLYPHAARPMVQYDGCVEPNRVTAMFTQAPGGKAIMERIGYPYPVEVSGWAYCPIRDFVPRKVSRVLFAPIHPNQNGYLNRIDKDLNRRTFAKLEAWCRETGTALSVRFIGPDPAQSGLADEYGRTEDTVDWHQGKKNNSTADMLTADLVVSHQTFAWMAVASGIPTLMMGEDVPPRTGNTDAGFRFVDHWDDYKDDLMFPLDILDESRTTDDWIRLASSTDEPIRNWRANFIGEPFDPDRFVKTLEGYL